MKRHILLLAVLLLAARVLDADLRAAALEPFRGVVGVSKAEAGIGDTLVVRVRELDGWLIAQMRKNVLLGESHFTPDQYRRWLALLDSVARDDRNNKVHFGQWVRSSLANGKPGDLNYDLMEAFDGLRQEIWDGFYLVLGNGRLKHINAEKPFFVSFSQAGITFSDIAFPLKWNPEDKEEWDKISHGTECRLMHSVRIGFDIGVAQYTLDTVAPQKMLPSNTAMPEDLDAIAGQPGAKLAGSYTRNFYFIAYSKYSLAAGLALVALAFIVFAILAAKSGIVRDPDLPPRGDGRLQFNLARCQMAFWFFLFTAAYVFIWVVKRETDTLTDQCLVLLGISTGTTLASAFITHSAGSRILSPANCPFNDGIRRFFWEILSDDAGKVTFYRFQMVVWTLVLGMVFIKSVYFSLAMPAFGSNELALMGISAGTYLAFKFPETAPPAGGKKANGGAA